MSEPFLSEIKLMSFNFAPKGWAQCNGQFLPINQNQALFALLGTTYGGNGQTTFALPDLRGKVPLHFGGGFVLGQTGGQTAHTVTISEMPQHIHMLVGTSNPSSVDTPAADLQLAQSSIDVYRPVTNLVAMEAGSVSNVGGSQPHNNMQPYLTLMFCIALQGIFPSQN
ncbi:phage tail protein [Ramlibacter sp. WS9]|uniref:phage tail protein n=1 Tax=Ramlibacter sp. WS9 TaxID=1882741 RepID=UPI001141C70A|nr:tail fiber protein [Ramlibacter sp. WS9]ROZ62396.1 phage tail protein [Ramlibacter sp. WS9]